MRASIAGSSASGVSAGQSSGWIVAGSEGVVTALFAPDADRAPASASELPPPPEQAATVKQNPLKTKPRLYCVKSLPPTNPRLSRKKLTTLSIQVFLGNSI